MDDLDDFIFVDTGNNSVRLCHKDTNIGFGAHFQALCRSQEWKSAYIVYTKYKQKYGLFYTDLINLREFLEHTSAERKANGKIISNDYMTQIASSEIKRLGEERVKMLDTEEMF